MGALTGAHFFGLSITVINLPVQALFARLDSAHSKKR